MDSSAIGSGGAVSTQMLEVRYEVSVAKKEQDATKLQAEAALALIESAAPVLPPRPEGQTGSVLNVVA